MNLPTAQQYLDQNWNILQNNEARYIEEQLSRNCQPFDRKQIKKLIYNKKHYLKKKEGKAFGGETYGSRSTIETLFKEEKPEQKAARLAAKAMEDMIMADPSLKSLDITQKEKRENIQQKSAVLEEIKTQQKNIDGNQFDSPSYSQDSQSSGEKSKVPLRTILRLKTCWREIKLLIKAHDFKAVRSLLKGYDEIMSFLILVRKVISTNPEFANTISFCLQWLEKNRYQLPIEIALDYRNFFQQFELHPSNKDQDMISLFKLCRSIKANIMWVANVKRPYMLFENSASLHGCAAVVQLLLQQKGLYSLPYFDFIDFIIQNPLLSEGINGLLQILNSPSIKIDMKLEQALLQISNIENSKYGRQIVQHFVTALLEKNEASLTFSLFLIVLEVALENQNIQDTKLFMGSSFSNKEELKQLIQESMEADAKHAEQRTKLAKEDQIKKDFEDKQKIEDKKNEEIQKEVRAQKRLKERAQYKQDLIKAEAQFKKANMTDQHQFKSKELGQLFEGNLQSLHKTVEVILNKQQLKLKPNQVVVLNLLLKCKSRVIFIQLGTGFGKSRAIIAPLADAVRWATGAKSVVVVPTKILRAIHHEYCIDAKYAPELLIDTDQIDTIYCTYDTFLENQHLIPTSANIFVDESHLFLKENARIIENKAILPSEILKRFTRVYMLSATFGGQQGIAELQKLFKGSSFIHSPRELAQKDLSQVQVIGNLACRDAILEKAVEVAKLQAQGMPVILFCKDDKECLKLNAFLQDASIFGGGSDTAQLLDIIRICKEISKDKVILTTQKACIGIDFIFKVLRAFVILTEDATYLEELLQPLGRSSRVNNKLPLLGCILTQGGYNDIQSLEKSLKDKSADLKIFSKQIRDNIGMLGVCPSAKTQNQLQKLGDAINSLNSIPNQNVKAGLQSITDFKKAIEQYFRQVNKTTLTSTVGGENNSSLVSIAQLLDQNELINQGILKKRNLQERESSNASGFSSSNEAQFFKRQKQKEQVNSEEIQMQEQKEQVNSEEVQMQDSSEEEQEVSAFQELMEEDQQQPSIDQQNHSNRATELNKQMDQLSEFEMDPEALKQKEINEAKDVLEKHGIKTLEQQDQAQSFIKPKSILSFNTNGKKAKTVYSGRDIGGRFKQKYQIGDRASDGSIIKEVEENNWQFAEKDKKGNSYYKCLLCKQDSRVLKSNRKRHICK